MYKKINMKYVQKKRKNIQRVLNKTCNINKG